jgi:N-acetylglutamate synthase-like GNAT family acetyltransferase
MSREGPVTAVAVPVAAPGLVDATLRVRDAGAADNAALVELAAACTMRGDIAMRVDRAPDFFALNRLEGERSSVGIVERGDGSVVGCVAVARRMAHVNDVARPIAYASDLKVHPDARGSGAADLLTQYAARVAADLCGVTAPVVSTILAGNAAMEHRARGPRGTAVLSRFATLDVLAIPLLWERSERVAGCTVRSANARDIEAMAATWREYAPSRQFADVSPGDATALAEWITRAPGLSIHDYLIALDAAGRVRGFLGVWDQVSFKQLRVVSYSRRLAVARRVINAATTLLGGAPLPPAGEVLPALATVHVCARDSLALRALLLEAYRRFRGRQYAFITVGLDARDPMRDAFRGLLPQSTLVHAYVTTPVGPVDPAIYSRRLLHHETALV